ncbi:hypothetical protein [Streptomyces sp. TLI_171]|uniref:hypothetical protein n=1 Tax=Streptomyces sp. TLI_171 TaxID=1938859 RepID=UPI000FED8C55|nr:hypothetical protein [Streptomyces sp. TLI_171]RKE21454.1 hypothetical protein BX266_4843 [Streptomyces sp. TLI_171]
MGRAVSVVAAGVVLVALTGGRAAADQVNCSAPPAPGTFRSVGAPGGGLPQAGSGGSITLSDTLTVTGPDQQAARISMQITAIRQTDRWPAPQLSWRIDGGAWHGAGPLNWRTQPAGSIPTWISDFGPVGALPAGRHSLQYSVTLATGDPLDIYTVYSDFRGDPCTSMSSQIRGMDFEVRGSTGSAGSGATAKAATPKPSSPHSSKPAAQATPTQSPTPTPTPTPSPTAESSPSAVTSSQAASPGPGAATVVAVEAAASSGAAWAGWAIGAGVAVAGGAGWAVARRRRGNSPTP